MVKSKSPLKHSIATKLLTVVFAIYFIVVVIVTTAHLIYEYNETRNQIIVELNILEKAFKRSISTAVWYLDISLINSEMKGMYEHPLVVGVLITNDKNDKFSIGTIKDYSDSNYKKKINEQNKSNSEKSTNFLKHEFDLIHKAEDGEEYYVGRAIIFSSYSVIFNKLITKLFVILLASLINMVSFWIIVFFVSKFLLSRPLTILTESVKKLDLNNLEDFKIDIKTKGNNELKILEMAFNTMVLNLTESKNKLFSSKSQLQEKQHQLQDILDNAAAVIYLKDVDGHYLLINRLFETTFSINKNDILGKTDYDIFPEEMADKFRENDFLVIDQNKPINVEETAPHKEGIHTYMSIKFPLYDINGNIYAVCGISTDISERKKYEKQIQELNQELENRVQERTLKLSETNILLQESEKRLKNAQRIAKLGNWDWNISKNELIWSDEIYNIFGINKKDFKANFESFIETVHPDDRELVQNAVNDSLYKNKPYHIDHRIVHPDGKIRIVTEQGEVTFNEKKQPIRMVGTILDITERMQNEKALQKAKESAEIANRAKSEFLANMSHELRTPLNAILGFSELILDNTNLTKEQVENLNIIARSGEHLLSLINDVLDFSKIEAGQIDLQEECFSLKELLTNLEEMFSLRCRQKNLTLDFVVENNVPHYLCLDKKKLRQVLINLLGNAVKYTEKGGVSLKIFCKKNRKIEKKCHLYFEIIDSGVGIAKKNIDKIFNAFYQVKNNQNFLTGTGLGLSITLKYILLMDGKLDVKSKPGEGSIFTINLPAVISYRAEIELNKEKKKVVGLKNKKTYRILIVEDDKINRNLLIAILKKVGFEVNSANNGKEALDLYEDWNPDLIFMDIRMPVLDGIETTKRIKKLSNNKKPIIIALSAGAFKEDKIKAINSGCYDFVSKPFKETILFEIIQKYLDVQYIYDVEKKHLNSKTAENKISDENFIEQINTLPNEMKYNLKNGLELSDIDMLNKILNEIKNTNNNLAENIEVLIKDYNYEKLLELIEAAENKKS